MEALGAALGVVSAGGLALDFENGSDSYLSLSNADFGAYDRDKCALIFSIQPESLSSNQYLFGKSGEIRAQIIDGFVSVVFPVFFVLL